jgi:hypothetical protein
VSFERVAGLFQLVTQVGMIVDFAVEDDGISPVRREYWLMAAGNVDDAEAPHSKAEIAVDEIPAIVGTSMDDGIALVRDNGFGNGPARSPVPPRYSAHLICFVQPPRKLESTKIAWRSMDWIEVQGSVAPGFGVWTAVDPIQSTDFVRFPLTAVMFVFHR